MIHSINNFVLNSLFLNPQNGSACCDNYIGTLKYCYLNGNYGFSYNSQQEYFYLERKNNNNKNNNNNNNNNITIQNRLNVDYSNFKPHSNNRKIVILLESPHIDEYINLTYVNSGPACGKSGSIFDHNVIKVFNNNINILNNKLNLKINEEFDLYFVNAIQYQCSLGYKNFNRNIRDFIFINLWSNPNYNFKDDLLDRLNIIAPDLIINACTQNLKNTCCNLIQIGPYLKNNIGYLDSNYHISNWNRNVIFI